MCSDPTTNKVLQSRFQNSDAVSPLHEFSQYQPSSQKYCSTTFFGTLSPLALRELSQGFSGKLFWWGGEGGVSFLCSLRTQHCSTLTSKQHSLLHQAPCRKCFCCILVKKKKYTKPACPLLQLLPIATHLYPIPMAPLPRELGSTPW